MPPAESPANTCPRKCSMRQCLIQSPIGSVPEVGTANGFVVTQCLAWTRKYDPTRLEQICVLREGERKRSVLLDEKNGHLILPVDPGHDLEDLDHDARRQTEGRFVHQQEPRPQHQRATDCQHLLL